MIFKRSAIALIFLPLSTFSFGLPEARVTGDNLNVRKFPNGELVEQLRSDQLVSVVKEKDGWSQIVYLKDDSDSASYGWVSSRYLELKFEAESTQCSPDPLENQDHCLSIMVPGLQCQMGELTASYKSCSVEVRYELSREQGALKDIGVACMSNLETRDVQTGSWTTAVQSAETYYKTLSQDILNDSVELFFDFSEDKPVSDLRIAETTCELKFEDALVQDNEAANFSQN